MDDGIIGPGEDPPAEVTGGSTVSGNGLSSGPIRGRGLAAAGQERMQYIDSEDSVIY
jgi:hypothetical protein